MSARGRAGEGNGNGSTGARARETMPLRRSICWRPVSDSYYLLAAVLGHRDSHYPVFVTQTALRELQEQLDAPDDTPFLGVLGGTVRESRERGLPYVIISRAVPLASLVSGKPGKRALRQARDAAAEHLADVGEEVLGWYRRRRTTARTLLPGDEFVTLELFPNPWQCALILSPGGGGALYRYKPEGERSYIVPFYEVLDDAEAADLTSQSAVDWPAYARAERSAYPESAGVELDEALQAERDAELGPGGRRLIELLRKKWLSA